MCLAAFPMRGRARRETWRIQNVCSRLPFRGWPHWASTWLANRPPKAHLPSSTGFSACHANSTRHGQVVGAFLAAARGGDINALVALLDPDVVSRADRAALPAHGATEIRGAQAVAEETRLFSQRARFARLALVNGSTGIVVAPRGQLQLALSLTVKDEQISEIDVIGDRVRLHELDLAVFID